MIQARTSFADEAEIKAYIDRCEDDFTDRLRLACRETVSKGSDIITLSGPSCSGKTTTATVLENEFAALGKKLHTVSIDDFYYSHDELKNRAAKNGVEIDYDSPDTIDMEAFAAVMSSISRRGKVILPKYDFLKGGRTEAEEIDCTPEDAFLFEGIQAVYPALTRFLAPYNYNSIFISVEQGLQVGDAVFLPREIRFLRRLVRDRKFRGASAQFTFSLWESVCDNEDKHIYPNAVNCNTHINSLLPYEINVIKPFVLDALDTLTSDSVYLGEAEKIRGKLHGVTAVSEKYVPQNSVFREFIG